MSDAPLRVVIADDHPFYRSGLARSLRQQGIVVVADAPNGAAAVRAVREAQPDVTVMDLNMPGVSGLEATRRVLAEFPDARVLMLTVSADEADLADAILAGACGYVLKDRPVREVIAAVRAAAAGESPFSERLAMPLLRLLVEAPAEFPVAGSELGERERTLLALLSEGRSEGEIAQALELDYDRLSACAAGIVAELAARRRAVDALRAVTERRT